MSPGASQPQTRYAEGPAASPGYLLWLTTLRWQRAVAGALAPLDLTHVQFVLLTCLWWLQRGGEQPNQLRLAQQAGTDVKMTSQVLRTLEGKGFLAREVDRSDTRAKVLQLTPAGRRLVRRALAVVERVDEEFFAAASREGPATLVQHLRALAG